MIRIGDIEFRWSTTNNKHELVKWYVSCDGRYCMVVAFFDRHREGFDMRTVGDRFFADHDTWKVGKAAMVFLQELHRITEDDNQ